MRMELNIHALTGRVFIIHTEPTATVKDLCVQVGEHEGIATHQVRLMFTGRELDKNNKLSDYGIKHDSTIHMMIRLKCCRCGECQHCGNGKHIHNI